MIDGYADIAVIRHPRQGAAQYAADAVEIPILNAGMVQVIIHPDLTRFIHNHRDMELSRFVWFWSAS